MLRSRFLCLGLLSSLGVLFLVGPRAHAEEQPRTSSNQLDAVDSRLAVQFLKKYLEASPAKRGDPARQPFATTPLTREEVAKAKQLLWNDRVNQVRETRVAEMKERKLREGELQMPFYYKTFGDKPKNGRSLFISMHGGGGTPKQVNDQQWENQKRLYSLKEGVYLVPRAPTDTWNLWHQGHIDEMFGRLIEDMIVFEDVDPNRVYIMGYSAGGIGWRLMPRMRKHVPKLWRLDTVSTSTSSRKKSGE